jgi:DNA-binding transcriptional LysR family regulator
VTLPSLDTLRCFVTAARILNFTKAARRVALTPAAFGQRIKLLEDQLGVALFQRTTRSVMLTEAGIAFEPFARSCLATAEEGVRAARGDVGPGPMDLVLGTRHELGLSWILPQLEPLSVERPWLHLHLFFGSGPDLILHTRSLAIDCAVTSAHFTDAKLDSVRLHREDYVFVASSALLRSTPLSTAHHAPGHTLLDISPDLPLFRYWRDSPGGGERLRFGTQTSLGTIAAIRQRALDGAGVAVLPEYLVRGDLATRRLSRIFRKVEPLHDYFRLVFRADDPRRAIFESLAASFRGVPLR